MATTAAQHPYFAGSHPLALAHRGGTTHPANVGIENTIAAFRNAVGLGFTYLETDVHATSDGEVVAFHDVALDRVTDQRGLIAHTPSSVVRAARIGGTEPIPLLRELFEHFPTTKFNIDLKSDGALAPTIATIREFDALDRVCLGTFSERRLRALRAAVGPMVATAAGQVGTAVLRFSPAVLSRMLHSSAPVLQIPAEHRIGGVQFTVVTPGLVRRAHALGKQVHVWFHSWGRQDAAEMHRLLDLGVDGLVVDDLLTLLSVFAERGHPLPGSDGRNLALP